jgi:hypothetical protein
MISWLIRWRWLSWSRLASCIVSSIEKMSIGTVLNDALADKMALAVLVQTGQLHGINCHVSVAQLLG